VGKKLYFEDENFTHNIPEFVEGIRRAPGRVLISIKINKNCSYECIAIYS
jgi:hypothetical protein